MLEHLIEIARGRAADRAKAHAYLAEHAASSFREMLADYDAFVPHVAQIEEPALLLGTAKDSSDAESPVRLPWEEIFCHWLVQGGTGTGKTTFVTLLVSSALREGQAIGVVDCKSGFFDQGVLWAGRACNSTPNTRNSALDDALVGPEHAALLEQRVHQRRLPVIDMGDDGDVAQFGPFDRHSLRPTPSRPQQKTPAEHRRGR